MQTDHGEENSKALAEIDSSVAFVETLLGRYTWDETERANIAADLNFIHRKRKDKYLNLSIIGEFSSGKSTFINALLRENLLESANLQGTTTANTVIRYAPNYDVIVNFKNGTVERFSDKNLSQSEFKAYIKELTTNQNLASQVEGIIIEHPAEALKGVGGYPIAIIDTPGTNSLERWHEEVTKTAIREISDVSLILTTTDKPMPITLNDFIRENLSDVLQQCIFIATKMDVVREKERESQLDYIRQKISDDFKLADPIVLPYTQMFVLGEADQEYRETYTYEKDDYHLDSQTTHNDREGWEWKYY